jgi:hypothetical protein
MFITAMLVGCSNEGIGLAKQLLHPKAGQAVRL